MAGHAARTRPGGLDHRILAGLQVAPASSVAEFSRRIEAPRPSISRSLQNLETLGYVARRGRKIEITQPGQDHLRSVIREVPTTLERTIGDARRLTEHQRRVAATLAPLARSLSVLPDLTGALGPSVAAALRHSELTSSRMREILAPFSEPPFNTAAETISQVIGNFAVQDDVLRSVSEAARLTAHDLLPSISKAAGFAAFDRAALQSAFEASLGIQRVQLDWLDAHRSFAQDVSRVITDNLVASSRLSSDIAAIGEASVARALLDVPLKTVLDSVGQVATAQQMLVRDSLAQIGRAWTESGPTIPGSASFATFGVAIPTGSSARFVGGVRTAISPGSADPGSESAPMVGLDPASVAAVLERLDPRFARLWQGAWCDLRSGSPNWARNVSHGARELLRQTIEELAPDAELRAKAPTDSTEKVTRKMRVKWIVGGVSQSGAAWADKLAGALDESYALLSAEAHTDRAAPRFGPDAVAGLLESMGGLLRFLVHCRLVNDGED